MRLEQLRHVLQVARCGSITRAASGLYVTQPTLSESISKLEEELGFFVFSRSRQGVTLTESGSELCGEIEKVLEIIDGWKRFSHTEECVENSINIAYTASTSGFLKKIAGALAESEPSLQACFYECIAKNLFTDLESGGYGLGISGIIPAREQDYAQQAEQKGWRLELLCEDAFHIMVSGKNPLAAKSFLQAADLQGLRLAMLPGNYETVAVKYFRPFFTQEYPCAIHDRQSIMQIVAEDEAVAVFPRLSMRDTFHVRQGLVKSLLLKECPLPIRFFLITRAHGQASATEQQVADIIRAMNFLEND